MELSINLSLLSLTVFGNLYRRHLKTIYLLLTFSIGEIIFCTSPKTLLPYQGPDPYNYDGNCS